MRSFTTWFRQTLLWKKS